MIEYGNDNEIKQFEAIAEQVRTLSQTPKNEELSILYGLYKQATVGNNRTPVPSIFDPKAKVKWDAWSKQGGKGRSAARREYIEFADKLLQKYPPIM